MIWEAVQWKLSVLSAISKDTVLICVPMLQVSHEEDSDSQFESESEPNSDEEDLSSSPELIIDEENLPTSEETAASSPSTAATLYQSSSETRDSNSHPGKRTHTTTDENDATDDEDWKPAGKGSKIKRVATMRLPPSDHVDSTKNVPTTSKLV